MKAPTVDTLTRYQRDELLKTARQLIEVIEQIPVSPDPCGECIFFGAGGRCDKWNAIVPIEHQPEGCGAFEPDIPF